MAALPDPNARRLSVEALAVVMVLAWAWRLRTMADRPVGFAAAIFLVAAATVPAFIDYGYALHEVWSGELIALSLAVHGPRRWPVSVAIALLALGARELAAPYLLAMGVLAWREGRRREALAWALAILAGLVGLTLHAEAVGSLTRPDDLTSAGWLVLGGWRFLLLLLKWNGVLLTAPAWVVATLAPLALLGLVAARGPLGDRLALVVVGYGAAFLVVGRPDNAYWGLMIAPLWPIGLLSTLPALRGLAGKVLTLRGRAPCSP